MKRVILNPFDIYVFSICDVTSGGRLTVVCCSGDKCRSGNTGVRTAPPGHRSAPGYDKYYYQLINNNYYHLTAVPAPPLLAVAAPRDDVAPAAVLALALLLAVLPVPALGTLQLALGVEIFLTAGIDIFSASRSKFKEYRGRML